MAAMLQVGVVSSKTTDDGGHPAGERGAFLHRAGDGRNRMPGSGSLLAASRRDSQPEAEGDGAPSPYSFDPGDSWLLRSARAPSFWSLRMPFRTRRRRASNWTCSCCSSSRT